MLIFVCSFFLKSSVLTFFEFGMKKLGRVIISISVFRGGLPCLLLYFKHIHQPEIIGFLETLLILILELFQYIGGRQSLIDIEVFCHQRHINIVFTFFSVTTCQLIINLVND